MSLWPCSASPVEGQRLEQGSGTRGPRSGDFQSTRGCGTGGEPQIGRGAGRLPGIMVKNARRIAQESAPKLLPLLADSSRSALRVGVRHDTGAGYACLSDTRKLPAGPRPLRKSRDLGGKRARRGGAALNSRV